MFQADLANVGEIRRLFEEVRDKFGPLDCLVNNAARFTRFDPLDIEEMCQKLTWLTLLTEDERRSMGGRAAEMVSSWGPDRFAQGTLEALDLATRSQRTSRSLPLEKVR